MPPTRILASLLATTLAVVLATVLPERPAQAFKPYTHAVVGDSALGDALDDGRVTIAGSSYPVRSKVVEALRRWPGYYRAGTIGPDGFPDLTYGQSVIHPSSTGEWLRYVLRSAWEAQSDKAYSADEKGQILAFAYGFLTHAAGDMWSHTLVNDFSGGVFPEAKEILTSVPKAAIALRHIIVEGYVGDATAGFDGNPARTVLPGGDVSDDSTPGLVMAAPTRWIYRTLVDPRRSLPTGGCGNGEDDDRDGVADDGCVGAAPYTRGKPEQQRGPLIDYFLDLQSDLQLERAMLKADHAHANCSLVADRDCKKRVKDVWVDTVRGQRHGRLVIKRCEARYFCFGRDLADLADDKLIGKAWLAYLGNWIDDIDAGLRAWGELGMATTRGLFDAQARRDLQNEECKDYAESTEARAQCEAKIGVTDVVLHQAEPFILDHLLSMLGAPDATGGVLKALKELSRLLDDILPVNPLRVPLEELKKRGRDLILKELRKVVGVDVATLDHMLKNPSVWMEVEQIQLDLGPLGLRTVNLFPPGTRARLDGILGLTEADRRTTTVPMPDGSTRTVGVLRDDAVARSSAPIDDAIVLSKMLLLDANGMNRLITDSLQRLGVVKPGAYARVYRDGPTTPANVMVDGLNGGRPWLPMIDGDHGWRYDGKPRFGGGAGHGGNGNFPLWESCLVRPAFAGAFFRDWENGTASFPALGDDTSSDDADTTAPTATITIAAPSYLRKGKKVSDIRRFLGAGRLEFRATDTMFAESQLRQRVLVQVAEGFSQRFFPGYGELELPDTGGEGDGDRVVKLRAGDPCNPLVHRRTLSFTLDTRDPVVEITAPASGLVVDSASKVPLAWSVRDPGGFALASGVDGDRTVAVVGDQPVTEGSFSAFGLYPGGHALEVTAVDRVENAGSGFVVFEVQATAESLVRNVDQGAKSQAFLADDEGAQASLLEWLTLAADQHTQGNHAAEGDALLAARQVLLDHRGGAIAEWYADYMVALVDDLLARHVPAAG